MALDTDLDAAAARLRAAGRYNDAARIQREARRARQARSAEPLGQMNRQAGFTRIAARLMLEIGKSGPAQHLLATALQLPQPASILAGGATRAPAAEPSLATGHIRLYRAEPTMRQELPEWTRQAHLDTGQAEASGRWFTRSHAALDWYLRDINPQAAPKVTYVDLPADQVDRYRVNR